MRLTRQFSFFILHVGEYLIHIPGMERMPVVLNLSGVRIVLGVNDQRLFAFGKHDVGLHDREHCAHIIVQLPGNL